jgi:hypothetical protein
MSADPVSVMSASEVVGLYAAAWDELDGNARRELLRRAWTKDGVYCDPTALVEGREALAVHIGRFHVHQPDHRIVVTTGVDEHDGWLRFGWRMLGPDEGVLLDGMDFGERDADGRIRRIVGFFGPLPPAGSSSRETA